ncbi:GDSL-type esterase/lipase family protein [Actinoplanes sp. TRM 88003]|uniref:GDSL-type esterase/lipase family protein n=1 Tax=Paractinoplanes aksuensis TaxID=2939490 RepID=A0ABT1DPK3_9ACTN|nr:SGNH/GDSL hydrolase family protein [Actinoplanes aksuensis]MCO8272774.1 GDSL-type esterase/lipase family protein [Actinoplanes aksuensis]
MVRRWHLVVLGSLAVFALACEAGAGGAGGGGADPDSPPPKGYPSSMAALGDSITAGFGSCGSFLACSRNSWSTGSAEAVDSHYRRILAKNPKIKGKARNFARPGAEADALSGQVAQAIDMKAQYVTILIGANDACAPTPAGMTSVTAFRRDVGRGLTRLKKGLPKAEVLVAGIPDLYRLWQLGRKDDRAVRAWQRFTTCPSMLADPRSNDESDAERRRTVQARINDYNDELRQACDKYGARCRWDNDSHETSFNLDLVNQVDFFHPDVEGQAQLADATYQRF